ncbi:MAG: glycosyltransferase family 2 protein [Bacteroidales bacterium]|nr:glycosyltransferase family 2 protein [Bacteroidales bacterium]
MASSVSVITPMYNVALLLAGCVRSLFAQTLSGFEVVFVDDCSTDGTPDRLQALLAELQPDRPDITVKTARHDHNRGVAAARNTAMELAEGDFVYSVDADDTIVPDALETLYRTALDREADIVVCEWDMVFGRNARRMHQPDVATGEELFVKVARGVLRWNLWLFLVRRTLYTQHDIRFIEGRNMGEDLMALLCMALHAGRVAVVHRPLYRYVQTNTSALTKHFMACREEVTANVEAADAYLRRHGPEHLYPLVYQLQLTVKLPLLISPHRADYEAWRAWFPEANMHIGENPDISRRTQMLQRWAVKRRYNLLRLYYYAVIKFVYGVLFR